MEQIKWDKYGCPNRCPECGNEKLDTVNHQWVCYKCGANVIQYKREARNGHKTAD